MSDREREQMTKAELIERCVAERRQFHELLGQLSEQQMLEPGVQGVWSVKDMVAHVVDWEERMIRWLGEGVQGETPEMPEPGLEWGDIDRLNEMIYAAHKDEPLAQVLAGFERLKPAVLESGRCPKRDLLSSERYPWTGGSRSGFWWLRTRSGTIRARKGPTGQVSSGLKRFARGRGQTAKASPTKSRTTNRYTEGENVIKIAEVFGPENVALWKLVAQCGVRHVVGGISLRPRPGAGPEEQPWSFQSLLRTKTAYKNAGFEFAVIESRPPMDKIKLGLPGRDEAVGGDQATDPQHGRARASRSTAPTGCRSWA